MSKDQSIKETLDVIRRALEDDDTKEFQNDVLILNKQVIDDGTVQRLSENKFRITSAEPNLEWIESNSIGMNVVVKDDSFTTAALALQGPNSRSILNSISSKSSLYQEPELGSGS